MTPGVLAAINAARAAGKPAVLARRLADNAQTLWVAGTVDTGGPWPDAVATAARAALRSDRGGKVEADGESWFVQVFNPPLRLVVVGAVHIAQALVPMARIAGYDPVLIDPRDAFGSAERFPGETILKDWPDEAVASLGLDARSALVLLTHDPKLDDPALMAALTADVFYIGALGSTRTHAKRVARLTEAGFSEAQIARIHAPIGLDIGAAGPAEIAVAILAEITAVLRGRAP
jgi:xanthine dehydrogenase accessory factor